MSIHPLQATLKMSMLLWMAGLVDCTCDRTIQTGPALTFARSADRLLHVTPLLRQTSPSKRLLRPIESRNFSPGYRELNIAMRGVQTGTRKMTLYGDTLREGASFVFECNTNPATLRMGLFAMSRFEAPGDLSLHLPSGARVIPLPRSPHSLKFFEIALASPPKCQAGARLEIKVTKVPPGVYMALPVLRVAAEERPAPVILISIDTLRGDTWEQVQPRHPQTQMLYGQSIRFLRAYASAPTTHPSHRVLLAGRQLGRTTHDTVDASSTWVSTLRENGYTTQGYVAGGYLRRRFGYGYALHHRVRENTAGFALGFDLYFEGLSPSARRLDLMADTTQPATHIANEFRYETRTLGPSMARSLAWLASYADEPVFHFVHGYDVHEYNTMEPWLWEEALEREAPSARKAIRQCMNKYGEGVYEKIVVHFFRNQRPPTKDSPNAQEGCLRLLSRFFYTAKAQSADAILGRYIQGLQKIGLYERALIVVTSDHGESLMDERMATGELHIGHNRLTDKNLHVPLWLKLPYASQGEDRTELVYTMDVGSTIVTALRLEGQPRDGEDLLRIPPSPRDLLHIADQFWNGVLHPDGGIFAYQFESDPSSPKWSSQLMQWQETKFVPCIDPAPCDEARRYLPPSRKIENQPDDPTMEDPMTEELRALGYVK